MGRNRSIESAELSLMARGFLYLVAIMIGILARCSLSACRTHWTVTSASRRYAAKGAPEVFNTDQGAQFTSDAFTEVLKAAGMAISMDGKGRWVDNVFIERLSGSVKYEEVYLHPL